MKLEYFDCNLAKEISFKLFALDIEMNTTLPGDAYSEPNKLTINPNKILKRNDINNPYTYMVLGSLFLDEVISENVTTEMVKMKYNKFVPLKNYQKTFGNNTINYQAHFDYYGIGENLVNDFAKTLF